MDTHKHIAGGIEHCERKSSDDELVVGVGGNEVGGDDGERVDDDYHNNPHSDELVVGGREGLGSLC